MPPSIKGNWQGKIITMVKTTMLIQCRNKIIRSKVKTKIRIRRKKYAVYNREKINASSQPEIFPEFLPPTFPNLFFF